MPALRSDAEVRQEAIETLTRDVRVDASRIAVEVSNGIVTLRGHVLTPFERRVAGDVVRRIKGVRDLRNELQVSPVVSRPDAEVATDVEAALKRHPALGGHQVQVEVQNGVVTLFGTVGSYATRALAEATAWQVLGVLDVIDQLALVPTTARTDSEIASEVRIDLAHNLNLVRQKIHVEVKAGTVYLRGTVSSLDQKWLADEVAWWTTGVRDVVNELTVEPGASS